MPKCRGRWCSGFEITAKSGTSELCQNCGCGSPPGAIALRIFARFPAASRQNRCCNGPPIVVIELLSPEDRISRYQERFADYRQMGIRNIWVVDPQTRRGYDCSTENWIEKTSFAIENSPIAVDLAVIFSELG